MTLVLRIQYQVPKLLHQGHKYFNNCHVCSNFTGSKRQWKTRNALADLESGRGGGGVIGVELKSPLQISQKKETRQKRRNGKKKKEIVIQLVIYLFDHYVYTYVIMRVNKK